MIVVLDRIPVLKAPFILIVNAASDADAGVLERIKKNTGSFEEKSRVLTNGTLELVYELRCKDTAALSKEISAVEGVNSVSVLAHDGEVAF